MSYLLFFIGIISPLTLFAQEQPIYAPKNNQTPSEVIEKAKPAEVKIKEPLIPIEENNIKRPSAVVEDLPPALDQNLLIEQTIQEHLQALRSFDPSKAYYAYTSSDFQNTVPLDVFKGFVKDNTVLFSNKSFNVGNVVFSGVVATVNGVLVSTDGKALKAEFDLIQENGKWKIRKINILSFSR